MRILRIVGIVFILASPAYALDMDHAVAFSKLTLACMDQSYPYKTDRVFSSDDDIKAQSYFHPAFYGCFDWHSAVHGHWALLRLLDLYPNLPNRAEIEKRLDKHFDKKLITKEAETYSREDQKRLERAYGYAWFLRLMIELRQSKLPKQKEWLEALTPLEKVIRGRFIDYLKVFDFPIRRGVHENSAFALIHGFDYATSQNDTVFLDQIKTTAKRFYLNDVQCPLSFEPEGDDFISPCLAEADLMRRVLTKTEFLKWFNHFWPKNQNKQTKNFLEPLTPTSITDAKAVHLVGLDFFKAWTLESVGNALPSNDPRQKLFLESSRRHGERGDELINKPGYEGSHWLASFAIFLFTHANE